MPSIIRLSIGNRENYLEHFSYMRTNFIHIYMHTLKAGYHVTYLLFVKRHSDFNIVY